MRWELMGDLAHYLQLPILGQYSTNSCAQHPAPSPIFSSVLVALSFSLAHHVYAFANSPARLVWPLPEPERQRPELAQLAFGRP